MPSSTPTRRRWRAPKTRWPATRRSSCKADVTDEEEIGAAFDQMVDRLGLIGGAGQFGRDRPRPASRGDDAELFRQILDVNLVGTFITCRAALERMGESLAIVNIASVSGLRANQRPRRLWRFQGRREADVGRAGAGVWRARRAGELRRAGPIETPLIARLHTPADRLKWLQPHAARALRNGRGSRRRDRVPAVARGELYQRPDACRRWRLPVGWHHRRRLISFVRRVSDGQKQKSRWCGAWGKHDKSGSGRGSAGRSRRKRASRRGRGARRQGQGGARDRRYRAGRCSRARR